MRACRGPLATFAVLLLALAAPARGGSILGFEEQTRGGESRATGPGKSAVLDIRSRLTVRLDREALRAASGERAAVPEELLAKIRALSALLQERARSLARVPALLEAWKGWQRTPSEAAAASFRGELRAVAGGAARLVTDPLVGPLVAERFRRLAAAQPDEADVNPVDDYRLVFEAGADVLADLAREVEGLARTKGIYVQLGAWLDRPEGSRALHLPGFDDNPLPPPHDPDPWKLAFSQAQLEEIDRYADLARRVNESGESAARAIVETVRVEWAASIRNATSAPCLEGLEAAARGALEALGSASEDARTALAGLGAEARSLRESLRELRDRHREPPERSDPGRYLEATLADVTSLRDRVESLSRGLAEKAETLQEAALGQASAVTAALTPVVDAAGGCAAEIRGRAGALTVQLGACLGLSQSGAFEQAAHEFGERVRRLSLAEVPAQASVDLRDAGYREPGDRLFVKLGIGTGGRPAEEVESASFYLYHTTWHPEVKISLIFADPLGDVDMKRRFQAAPSYSVLLKKASRRSLTYNELIDPGFGLNVAALDFDPDESLELGLGGVLSGFRDYLQVGGGYNLTVNRWYWFLGLRLPLPSLGGGGTE